MPFSEKIKFEVKRKSHQTCCICKLIGIEIHHIIPQSEGGKDIEENAAPLCPSCHEIYGANPTKRKFIKESKEIWFEICSRRFANESQILIQLANRIELIEGRLGITADQIYSSIDKSQNLEKTNSEEKSSFVNTLQSLMCIESPSIEDTDVYLNFHVTYLLVFETTGDASEENQRFNLVRNMFLESFGRYFAEKIVLHQMKTYKIDWNKGILEPTLITFLTACKLFMILILTDPGFERRNTDLVLTTEEQEIIDSVLSENDSD